MANRTAAYTHAQERVYGHAARHAQRYSDPEGFLKHFQINMTDLRDSNGALGTPMTTEDVIDLCDTSSLGAEIEALSAARLLATLTHEAACGCDPCRVRFRPRKV